MTCFLFTDIARGVGSMQALPGLRPHPASDGPVALQVSSPLPVCAHSLSHSGSLGQQVEREEGTLTQVGHREP